MHRIRRADAFSEHPSPLKDEHSREHRAMRWNAHSVQASRVSMRRPPVAIKMMSAARTFERAVREALSNIRSAFA